MMKLSDLSGRGWMLVDPPEDTDPTSVIARYRGSAIKAGFTLEEDEQDDSAYFKFRTGKFNVELKIDFMIGRAQVRVTDAEGYR